MKCANKNHAAVKCSLFNEIKKFFCKLGNQIYLIFFHIWGGNNFLVGQIKDDKVERLCRTSEQVSTDGKN